MSRCDPASPNRHRASNAQEGKLYPFVDSPIYSSAALNYYPEHGFFSVGGSAAKQSGDSFAMCCFCMATDLRCMRLNYRLTDITNRKPTFEAPVAASPLPRAPGR